jgi:hypothetical protein
MRSNSVLGLVLVLAGVLLIVLYLSGVFTETAGVDLGIVDVEVETQRNLPWLPWVAGGGVVVGALLMITGRK